MYPTLKVPCTAQAKQCFDMYISVARHHEACLSLSSKHLCIIMHAC